jgi:mono/diheme cytochrome c family protein
MPGNRIWLGIAVGVFLSLTPVSVGAEDLIEKGRYLVRAGGCVACHTDVKGKGPELAGGRAMLTPYGTFHTPNITPDKDTGIGAWSDGDFIRALREGLSPEGDHYYPVFPYPTYTKVRDEDMLAMKAYLFSLKPVRRENKEHNVGPPFGWRILLGGWKTLHFTPGVMKDDPGKSAELNRGAYLVEAVAHCGECHTPRNAMGALLPEMSLAGTLDGPDKELVPNITPDADTGIGRWTKADIVELMKTGLKPDYDDVQGGMEEAMEYGLKYLTDEDLAAMAAYLKSLAPIWNKIAKAKK